ncbi:MAG TPA: DUF302 domain-containing protein [Candidatus Baltobacteraceae bacterium]|jgi:uncharacterized protein (DUF302 family)
MSAATDIAYGRVVDVSLPFEGAVEATIRALEAEGFAVVTDFDIQASLQKKLGETFRPYRILGVCNAQLARAALSVEPQLGLLVPCNVVVQEIDGRVIVSAIDANLIVQTVRNRSLEHVAADANARLKRALNSIAR